MMRLFHLLWLFILWLKMEKSSQVAAVKCRLTLPPLEGTSYEPAYRKVFAPDEQVTVTCGEKYWISRPQDTSAVITCTDNGEWTLRPECKEVTCSNQHERNVQSWDVYGGQKITLGDTARYMCREDYKSTDGSYVATCTRDGWRPYPLCQEVLCDKPDIQDADIIHNEKESYSHKEQVQFECKYGVEKRFNVTCEQGNWTEIQSCAAVECRVTGVPRSVRITTNVQNNQVRRGQKLSFACRHHQHFLHGKAVVECLADGQWSAPFPTCGDPVGCDNPPPLTDGDIKESLRFQYSHNERVEYICRNLYQMEGEPYQTCRNGKWFGKMRCLRPCTVDAEAMNRHKIAFKFGHGEKLYAPHNDAIMFRCVSGIPDGRLSLRQRCIDGVMHLPTCN